jgi:hypothetical protein
MSAHLWFSPKLTDLTTKVSEFLVAQTAKTLQEKACLISVESVAMVASSLTDHTHQR